MEWGVSMESGAVWRFSSLVWHSASRAMSPHDLEVADVHSSPRITYPMVRGPFYGGGRYELRYATLLDLIQTAYNVAPETVFGGPSWLAMDRFDVLAVAPAASTAKSQALMLQALLAERFTG